MKKKIILWEVSVLPIGATQRKYHVFSSLYKATSWIRVYVMECFEANKSAPLESINISVYSQEKLPKLVDGYLFTKSALYSQLKRESKGAKQ